MIKSLILAAAFLPSPPAFAQDAAQPTERQIAATVEQDAEKPAPQLISLDLLLTKTQEDKQQGRIDEEGYQEFLRKFRADLEAARARVKPTAANVAQHARILSRLGDSEQAMGTLGPALEQEPAHPTLRVALGWVHFDQKDYPAALEEANAVLEIDPANKGALGLKHFSEGRIGSGSAASSALAQGVPGGATVEQFRAPLAKDSPKVQALVPGIRAARNSGDMRTAMSLAQELMRAEPASEYTQEIYRIVAKDHARWQRVQATIGHINNAKAALLAGRGDEALAWANKAVQTDPAPAVMKFAEEVRTIVGNGKVGEAPQKSKAPKDGGIPLWPMLPIAGLGAAAYAVTKSRKTVESEDGFDEENRPLYGQLQQFVAGAILAGIAGAGVYFVGAAAIPVALRYLAGPGQHATRLLQSEAGAINPTQTAKIVQVTDHIVLGIRGKALEKLAGDIGARHLLDDGNWRESLRAAIGNPSARFTVRLDGFSGAGTYSKLMGAAQRGMAPGANLTEWEVAQLYQAGRLSEVALIEGGKAIQNPLVTAATR